MTVRVIQGFFPDGIPRRLGVAVAPQAIQPTPRPHPPGPSVPSFASRPRAAQRVGGGAAFAVNPARLGSLPVNGRPSLRAACPTGRGDTGP